MITEKDIQEKIDALKALDVLEPHCKNFEYICYYNSLRGEIYYGFRDLVRRFIDQHEKGSIIDLKELDAKEYRECLEAVFLTWDSVVLCDTDLSCAIILESD